MTPCLILADRESCKSVPPSRVYRWARGAMLSDQQLTPLLDGVVALLELPSSLYADAKVLAKAVDMLLLFADDRYPRPRTGAQTPPSRGSLLHPCLPSRARAPSAIPELPLSAHPLIPGLPFSSLPVFHRALSCGQRRGVW